MHLSQVKKKISYPVRHDGRLKYSKWQLFNLRHCRYTNVRVHIQNLEKFQHTFTV